MNVAQRAPLGGALKGVLITPSGGGYLLQPVTHYLAPAPAPAAALAPSQGQAAAGVEQIVRGVRAPRRRRWLRRALVSLGVAGVLVGTGWAYRAAQAKKPPTYVLARVEARDLKTTVTATGALEAVTSIDLGAEVTGRVTEIYVEENQVVRRGQVLARLDADELQASVAQAAAQVAGASASVDLARATREESRLSLQRLEGLFREGLTSQQELEAARANAARSSAALANARAQASLSRAALAAAQSKRDKTTIISPIDGMVLTRMVERGQTVTAGFQTPVLFRIAQDLTQMRLRVELDEADVARVRPGQSASFTVAAYPDREFQARVVRVSHDSRVAGNVVVFGAMLELDNSEQLLRPGMTCTVSVVTDQRSQVLTVPNSALGLLLNGEGNADGATAAAPGAEPEGAKVWKLRDASPVAVRVAAGLAGDEHTEITAGDLNVNDQVIIEEQPR
jgi:HlyD family secretion protein